jgi:hypothetical protein
MGLFSRFCARALRRTAEEYRHCVRDRRSCFALEHDPEKWAPVFPRDISGTRLRGDHAQIKEIDGMTIQRKVIPR